MKVAFCTEDRGDTELLRCLATRILGVNVYALELQYRLEPGGWSKALQLAPLVARAAHRTEAQAVVFAIDNDSAEPVHDPTHDPATVQGCRHCELVRAARVDEVRSWARPGFPPLHFSFVVPVRTLETWLLIASHGAKPTNLHDYGRTPAERRDLKRRVYGTDRPDVDLAINRGTVILQAASLHDLAAQSPSFRHFRDDLLGAERSGSAVQPPGAATPSR